MTIRPAMTDGPESWPIRKQYIKNECSRVENVEMDVW